MYSEAIDFHYVLLENYKKMKISENELATLVMIEHLVNQGNPFVTADLLSLKMSMDIKEIDNTLTTLLTRGFIEYKTVGNKTSTTLDPLKQKLYREFQISLSKEEADSTNKQINNEVQNVYEQFECLLGRTLSPVEISKIREWVSYGYSDQRIINALKEAINNNKKTLRAVDKILLSWAQRDDIEIEGHTPITEEWKNNLEETIRIAKTPWIIDDDE